MIPDYNKLVIALIIKFSINLNWQVMYKKFIA